MERLNFAYFLWSLRPILKFSSSSPSTILQISFPPIPGYKSATIWCLLDNDESGHVNVCEHRAPRLPLLPAFWTCSPPRSPKIFSYLSPNFLKILYSGIFSNSTANDSVHLQYFSFPATTFSLEGLFTKMVGVKPQRRVFAFRSKPSRYERTRNKSWWTPWRVCFDLDKSTRTLRIGKFFLPGLAISI